MDSGGSIGPEPQQRSVQTAFDGRLPTARLHRKRLEIHNAHIACRHRVIIHSRRGNREAPFIDAQRDVASGAGEETAIGQSQAGIENLLTGV